MLAVADTADLQPGSSIYQCNGDILMTLITYVRPCPFFPPLVVAAALRWSHTLAAPKSQTILSSFVDS